MSNPNRALDAIGGFKQHTLKTSAGRAAFLFDFSERGFEFLEEAAAHVYSSLAAPQDDRCTGMGLNARAGGTGRSALLRVLLGFLEELDSHNAPLPDRQAFSSSDEWHQAVSEHFGSIDAHISKVISKFECILGGIRLLRAC